MSMCEIHRHDEYSAYDGYGKPIEYAKLASELGYTALGIANHGTVAGNIQHYQACRKYGIKPILGVEVYFKPTFNLDKVKENKDTTRYHLCLFAKDREGYENLNRIMFAAEDNKYFKSIVTFELLQKYHKGIICSSACVQGLPAQAILKDKTRMAEKALKEFKKIFEDDFYIEIQPYKIDEEGTQEYINEQLMELAEELDIKCILTSDAHYTKKEEFDSYVIMHDIAKHDYMDIERTYKERYLPHKNDMPKRCIHMHKDIPNIRSKIMQMIANMTNLEHKVDADILEHLTTVQMPKIDGIKDSGETLKRKIREGIKYRGMAGNKKVIKRCQMEYKIISELGFEDYFLMVQDYVVYAKDNGILVGDGRGSVCNSMVAYVLRITEVDSLFFNLDFRRFLREGKHKIPDIDIDFETGRRNEVIRYILKRYPGHSAQVGTYGLYRIDNLINDLWKVCGELGDEQEKKDIKNFVRNVMIDEEELREPEFYETHPMYRKFNDEYDNILVHFSRFYGKVRYTGTHAAGVAISYRPIIEYCALKKDKEGNIFCVHDLVDMESIGVIKFDVLGLITLSKINDMMQASGVTELDAREILEDENIINMFAEGDTDGVFQFDRPSCQELLRTINVESYLDIVATNALNRPAALQLKMHEQYAANKINNERIVDLPYYDYVKETNGCIIYQEQVLAIAINIGEMTPDEADILVKMEHNAGSRTKRELDIKYYEDFKEKFVRGATEEHGMSFEEADNIFNACAQYGFNKGHAAGYVITALREAYFKYYYPTVYWCMKIKYTNILAEQERFSGKAAAAGTVVFLPHVNFSNALTSLRTVEGELIIQKGLNTIKGVGEKAADYIYKERRKRAFISYDDFVDRCKGREVNAGTINKLKECGALDFNRKQYNKRLLAYNSALYMRGTSK